jgi:hypothetical protein
MLIWCFHSFDCGTPALESLGSLLKWRFLALSLHYPESESEGIQEFSFYISCPDNSYVLSSFRTFDYTICMTASNWIYFWFWQISCHFISISLFQLPTYKGFMFICTSGGTVNIYKVSYKSKFQQMQTATTNIISL